MQFDSKLAPWRGMAILAAIALSAAPAEGSLVRYDFAGHIEEMTATGPGVSSNAFKGTLIYDDATGFGSPRPNPWGSGEERTYLSGTHAASAPAADGTFLQLWIDGKAVAPESTGLTGVLVPRPSGGSELVFLSHPRDSNGYFREGGISVSFDVSSSLLETGRFPDGMTVGDLPMARVGIQSVMDGKFIENSSFGYFGPVDSFTVTPVPEPAWTVASLLAATAWIARRRRSRA